MSARRRSSRSSSRSRSSNRNDLCPCGSGKKFEKCCFPLHQKRARWDPLEDRLRDMIRDFFNSEMFSEDYLSAMRLYGVKPEDRKDVGKWRLFLDWFIHDYVIPAQNETIIKVFFKQKGKGLGGLERDAVKSWSEATFSFYEVTGIRRGIGFGVKDIFDGQEYFVFDISGSNALSKYDLMFVRLYKVGDIIRLSGAGKTLSHTKIGDVRKFVEHGVKSSGADAGNIREYFQKHSLDVIKYIDTLFVPPTLITPEGDLVLLSKAQYRVSSVTKASKILKSSEQFLYYGMGNKVRRFDWIIDDGDKELYGTAATASELPGAVTIATHMQIEEEGEGEGGEEGESKSVMVMGNLSLKKDSLVIECVSEQRLQRCKKIVEDLLAGLVVHVADTYEETSLEGASSSEEEKDDQGVEEEPDLLSYQDLPQQSRRSVEKYFENYYRKWLDTPQAGLGNVTPLEASKTPRGRMLLDDLLKDMENMREREGGGDSVTHPVEKLRKRLRL